MIMRTLNPGFPMTRQHIDQILPLLNDNDKNQRIKIRAGEIRAEDGLGVLQNMSNFDAFVILFSDFSKLLGAVLLKAIYGVRLYTGIQSWINDTTRLRTMVSEMLVALADRGKANQFAQEIIARRRNSQEDFDRFIDKIAHSSTKLCFRHQRTLARIPI